MCRFKSGLILKGRVHVPNIDSHSDMLEELGIKDDYLGATEKFVRAELTPNNDEWWTTPDEWKLNIDQDVLPEWFTIDRQKYESDFREAIKAWWTEHVLIDQKIEELTTGYYRLKRCEVKKLLNDVEVMCDSSSVHRMYGSSSVQEMYDSSSVQEMYGSSSVHRMYGSSSVQEMYDSSSVQRMYESSSVHRMYGSSSVHRMCDSSSVHRMYGSSSVQEMYDSSSVQRMYESSSVHRMCESSSVQRMYGSSIARNYEKGKIFISPKSKLKAEIFENPKEES